MFAEIRKVAQSVLKENEYAGLRRRVLYIGIAFILLNLLNRFILVDFTNQARFLGSLARIQAFIQNGQSPYQPDVDLQILGFSSASQVNAKDIPAFYLPIYALVFYSPFLIIKNTAWSVALWLTVHQILLYFMLRTLISIFKWKFKEVILLASSIVFFLAYYAYGNILDANLAILQLALIIFFLAAIRQKHFILAGILLGFATLDPFRMFFPLIILFLLNFANQRNQINSWAFITILLASLFFIIFNMRWPIEWVKALFLQTEIYPFNGFQKYASHLLPALNVSPVNLLPVIVFIWLALEWSRSPKETFMQQVWMLSLALTLTPLLNMWDSLYSSAAFMLVLCYTTSLWLPRISTKFKIFALGVLALVMLILPAVQMVKNHGQIILTQTYSYNIMMMVLMLLSLYWVRLWVMNPHASIERLDEI